jgi:hypothetical protein
MRQEPWRARYLETGTPGSASGLGKRARSNPGTAPQADSTRLIPESPKHPGFDVVLGFRHVSNDSLALAFPVPA